MTQPWQLCKSSMKWREIIQNIHAIKSPTKKGVSGPWTSWPLLLVPNSPLDLKGEPVKFIAARLPNYFRPWLQFFPTGLGAVGASSDKSGSPPYSTLTFPRDFSLTPSKACFFCVHRCWRFVCLWAAQWPSTSKSMLTLLITKVPNSTRGLHPGPSTGRLRDLNLPNPPLWLSWSRSTGN